MGKKMSIVNIASTVKFEDYDICGNTTYVKPKIDNKLSLIKPSDIKENLDINTRTCFYYKKFSN